MDGIFYPSIELLEVEPTGKMLSVIYRSGSILYLQIKEYFISK